MAGRRTDTRERIQRVALELFAERGYDKTSLQEVAERLEITRPALYYHFRAKEDILNSVVETLLSSIEELVGWAGEQPRTPQARLAILRRISELLESQWRPLFAFAQNNQGAMRDIPAGEHMDQTMFRLLSVLSDPDADARRQFESRLAVVAVIIGSIPFLAGEDVTDDERASVALDVAT
ncbi:MAG: TetR/AcrR family transcriptional regulator, partial [Nonomuraea sp.]|nr:TetR/AcrR family transcriptional regulator [Nonomuraea sp.]